MIKIKTIITQPNSAYFFLMLSTCVKSKSSRLTYIGVLSFFCYPILKAVWSGGRLVITTFLKNYNIKCSTILLQVHQLGNSKD